jgi:putative oxidoreductase
MIKKLSSTQYHNGLFNFSALLLRLIFGALMMHAGYNKLMNFDEIAPEFMNFMQLGSKLSLGLVVFSEFFCSLFLILGLFTRISLIPLIITMVVALFKAHQGDVFGDGSEATLYLAAYISLLLIGPGKISVDGLISK